MQMKRLLILFLAVIGLAAMAQAQQAVPIKIADVQAAHAQARKDYPVGFADLAVWRYAYRLGELLVTEEPGNVAARRLLAQIYAEANWPYRAWGVLDGYRKMGGAWDQAERNLATRIALQMAFYAVDRGDPEDAHRWGMQAASLR